MKRFFTILFSGLAVIGLAQSGVDPTSDAYAFNLKPFRAEYTQMGNKLNVVTTLSADEKIYNIAMSMPDLTNPSHVISDVIGISARDGSFIYRDFHLLIPSWRFNRAEYRDGKVMVTSYASSEPKKEEAESVKPVFDGTFAYWQLAGMNAKLKSFSINRWKYAQQGLVVGMSDAPIVFENEETIEEGGKTYQCRLYTVEVAPGTKVLCYVSDQPPYLVRQSYQQEGAKPMTILAVSKVY